MSEKDLELKLATRRLYWSMGMTTRLNVKLSTHVTGGSSRSRIEEFTDLDVLGIAMAPNGQAIASIGDCKTVRKSANERCFWLRGVSDFFNATSAHLVRSFDVPVSTRQLAERLGLGVLTVEDLATMQQWYERPVSAELSILFEAEIVQLHQKLISTSDSKLNRLVDYRNLGYWIVEPHRTLDGIIHHLNQAASMLSPSDAGHVALLLDMSWLFGLSLVHATASIRDIHASQIETAFKQYIFGGAAGLRDKQNQADLIRKLTETSSRRDSRVFDVLPGYFAGLLEVVTRHLRRPLTLIPMLRYAEWLSIAPAVKELRGISAATAFGEEYDKYAGKLLADTIRFLVSASRLTDEFMNLTQLAMPTEATSQAPTTDTVEVSGRSDRQRPREERTVNRDDGETKSETLPGIASE